VSSTLLPGLLKRELKKRLAVNDHEFNIKNDHSNESKLNIYLSIASLPVSQPFARKRTILPE